MTMVVSSLQIHITISQSVDNNDLPSMMMMNQVHFYRMTDGHAGTAAAAAIGAENKFSISRH